MKRLVMEISNCAMCPNCINKSTNSYSYKFYCEAEDKTLAQFEIDEKIPDWCPLNDYNSNNENVHRDLIKQIIDEAIYSDYVFGMVIKNKELWKNIIKSI
jgi:hypothetical protein